MTEAPAALSVCAIVKNEAEYLREWIEFHLLAGVGRFYIYDNGSTDNLREVLWPYYERDLVQIIHWPGRSAQLSAYHHALHAWGRRTRWMAFLDADEFLFAPTGEHLAVVLRDYSAVGAVGVCWAVYGTSDVQDLDGRLVTETLRYRSDSIPLGRHIKSIVRTARAIDRMPADPHHFDVDGPSVDELRRPLDGPFAESPTHHRLRINHYVARSVTAGLEKMRTRRADNDELRTASVLDAAYNEVHDYAIEPWIKPLKERMR